MSTVRTSEVCTKVHLLLSSNQWSGIPYEYPQLGYAGGSGNPKVRTWSSKCVGGCPTRMMQNFKNKPVTLFFFAHRGTTILMVMEHEKWHNALSSYSLHWVSHSVALYGWRTHQCRGLRSLLGPPLMLTPSARLFPWSRYSDNGPPALTNIGLIGVWTVGGHKATEHQHSIAI